ncbi:hypothetical protein [Enterococcus sp. 4E1_DIV0656]|uniref:hypothetical protein n=1 Tax=unclassified Enterococcus TaxID=2608891 RepID=UPI000A3BB0EA|nr:hypothetical protein [Enterococcus sp. 4E1_DIV0656]OTO09147.1 hypothetical protein A5882_003477 [Enterococcus sp. 4E1_DIV0656]
MLEFRYDNFYELIDKTSNLDISPLITTVFELQNIVSITKLGTIIKVDRIQSPSVKIDHNNYSYKLFDWFIEQIISCLPESVLKYADENKLRRVEIFSSRSSGTDISFLPIEIGYTGPMVIFSNSGECIGMIESVSDYDEDLYESQKHRSYDVSKNRFLRLFEKYPEVK